MNAMYSEGTPSWYFSFKKSLPWKWFILPHTNKIAYTATWHIVGLKPPSNTPRWWRNGRTKTSCNKNLIITRRLKYCIYLHKEKYTKVLYYARCFTPFWSNFPCQFTPLLHLRPLIFGLTLFGWFISINLNVFLWKHRFWFTPFLFTPTF